MCAQRIILVNCSRLLSDLLHTIIHETDDLEMVQEIKSDEARPDVIEPSEAEWMIMPVLPDKKIPGWVDHFIAKHPSMRFLAIFLGSNKVKLKSLEYEEDLEDLSLTDLIQILERHPQHV